jgi:phenylacetate-coenzyme A ligase PaaK-like adenylate-forming protein
VLEDGPDPSGRPYLRVARVDGRSSDFLRFPAREGGEVAVHPYRLRAPFFAMLDVCQYQIVRIPDGLIRVELVDEIEREAGHAAKVKLVTSAA